MASRRLSGKSGDIKINGTALLCTEWDVTVSADELETTNKGSGGNQDFILGITRAEGTFKAAWYLDLGGSNVPPYATVAPQEGAAIQLDIGDQTQTTQGHSKL